MAKKHPIPKSPDFNYKAHELAHDAPAATTAPPATTLDVPYYADFVAISSAVPFERGWGINNNAQVVLDTEPGHRGIIKLAPASTNTVADVSFPKAQPLKIKIGLGGGVIRMGCLLKTPSVLSNSVTRYKLRFGFIDVLTSTDAQNLVEFQYVDNVNNGRWEGRRRVGGGSISTIDLGVTVTVDTWYKLEIVIAADASSCEFFINDVSRGTISQSMPTVAGFIDVSMFRILGTDQPAALLDYAYYHHKQT